MQLHLPPWLYESSCFQSCWATMPCNMDSTSILSDVSSLQGSCQTFWREPCPPSWRSPCSTAPSWVALCRPLTGAAQEITTLALTSIWQTSVSRAPCHQTLQPGATCPCCTCRTTSWYAFGGVVAELELLTCLCVQATSTLYKSACRQGVMPSALSQRCGCASAKYLHESQPRRLSDLLVCRREHYLQHLLTLSIAHAGVQTGTLPSEWGEPGQQGLLADIILSNNKLTGAPPISMPDVFVKISHPSLQLGR